MQMTFTMPSGRAVKTMGNSPFWKNAASFRSGRGFWAGEIRSPGCEPHSHGASPLRGRRARRADASRASTPLVLRRADLR